MGNLAHINRLFRTRVCLLNGIFLLFSLNLRSQVYPSSCAGSATLLSSYKTDAGRLAVKRAFDSNSSDKDSVEIHQTVSNQYLNALLSVYNATALPVRDTIVYLDIHTNPFLPLNNFVIKADSGLLWMKKLRLGSIPTGDISFDNIAFKYGMQCIPNNYFYHPLLQYHSVLLRTNANYNLFPLCNQFMYLPGVQLATPDATLQPEFHIFDPNSSNPNFTDTYLTFTVGWDDCIAGCMYRRYWSFRVMPDCSVEYLGATGPALPLDLFFVNVAEDSHELKNMKIFPNPGNGQITVHYFTNRRESTTILVTDIIGRKMHEETDIYFGPESNSKFVDLSRLPDGIYLVTIVTEDGKSGTYKQIISR